MRVEVPLSRVVPHANAATSNMRNRFEVDPSQLHELWQAALHLIRQDMLPEQISALVAPLQFLGTRPDGDKLLICFGASTDWNKQWIMNHPVGRKTIESAFTQLTGNPCILQIDVQPRADDVEPAPNSVAPPVVAPDTRLKDAPANPAETHRDRVNPHFQFDNFVVGTSNQFAHASAFAVAENPARDYNPLFIYSRPGLGKTHLLHAIANHYKTLNPQARIAYLSAEQFVNELVESLRRNQGAQFRNKFRNSYDMILIDDIQFLAGKGHSEEEFFHTFNALHSSQRQIVVTSDRPPKDIEGLEERVKTRFLCGLVADIQPPEIETRIAILKGKAERDDVYLPDDVATFLATHIKSNVRELEGTLIRLKLQASLTGAEISLEMAQKELNIIGEATHHDLTIEAIQAAVIKHYGLRLQDLKSAKRARKVAQPRQIAMYLTRKYTKLSLKQIAANFGKGCHTTVVHACREIEKGMDSNNEIRTAVESIQNLL